MCKRGYKSIRDKARQEAKSFMAKLVHENNDVSTLNFFVLAVTFVGVILLLIPAFAMVIDVIYNHSITMDLSGLSSYILAVAGIFTTAGITNEWSEHSYNKFNKPEEPKPQQPDPAQIDTPEQDEYEVEIEED